MSLSLNILVLSFYGWVAVLSFFILRFLTLASRIHQKYSGSPILYASFYFIFLSLSRCLFRMDVCVKTLVFFSRNRSTCT